MDIKLRGQTYSVETIADTQILPLAKVFGLKQAPDEGSPHYERWKTETTNVFMEPSNQGAVAYVLVSLFPGIDPAIARYKIKRYDEGYSELDFHLAINMDELLEALDLLAPLIQARADRLKKTPVRTQPKGFGNNAKTLPPEPQPELTKDEQIAALEQALFEARST